MRERAPDSEREGVAYFVNGQRRHYLARLVPLGVLLSLMGAAGFGVIAAYILSALVPGFDYFYEVVIFGGVGLFIVLVVAYPVLEYRRVPAEVGVSDTAFHIVYASGKEDVLEWRGILLMSPYPVPNYLKTRDRMVRLDDVDPEVLRLAYGKWKERQKK